MIGMFKNPPFTQSRIGTKGKTAWGPAYGDYGMTFLSTFEGPRDPGPVDTALSLRRVYRREVSGPELQLSIEIRQGYRSGANSRRMFGSLGLHGPALAEFARSVLLVEGSKALTEAKATLDAWEASSPPPSTRPLVDALRELVKLIDPMHSTSERVPPKT
jgi:hypothetical protein